MSDPIRTVPQSATETELSQLRSRLQEAEDALRAIRGGEVDALVIRGSQGEQIYTLNGADSAYRVLVEAFAEGALTLLEDGAIAYCNLQLAVLLARPLEEVIGSKLRNWVASEDLIALERLLSTGRSAPSKGEIHFVRPDGSRVPIQLSCNAIDLGDSIGVCAIATDLSAQRRSEELERLQQELRETDRRKDAFLATLAHELRNPLAPIRTATHLLGMPNVASDAQRHSLGVIQRQVKHMALLLDDLLDVARITQGKLELKRERVALVSIVDTAVESARPLIDSKHHELVVDIAPNAPDIEGDPLRLAQILSNLLNNAAKYTDAGGRIELSTRSTPSELIITVKDNGIGIPTEDLTSIFQMFSQIEGTGQRSEGGLGIGLSLVKGLVELHGGHIEARSDGPGQGSAFILRLPLGAAVSATASTLREPQRSSQNHDRRILIADDNQDAADTLAMLLKMDGYQVRVAHGGKAALALAATFRPDIALLDIGMPDLNGYELATQLRAQSWSKDLILVAVTGWGQADDRRRASAAGFDRHVTKPVDLTELETLFRPRPAVPALRSIRR